MTIAKQMKKKTAVARKRKAAAEDAARVARKAAEKALASTEFDDVYRRTLSKIDTAADDGFGSIYIEWGSEELRHLISAALAAEGFETFYQVGELIVAI